jgi:predicted RNA binding protein YcfA (HicA-like mRNA interferase family)
MKILSGKDVCKVLNKFGFKLVRQKGNHAIMQKIISSSTITVPVPLHKELKIATLMSIIRQIGISKENFE